VFDVNRHALSVFCLLVIVVFFVAFY